MKNWSYTKILSILLGLSVLVYSCKKEPDLLPADETIVQNMHEHLQMLELQEGIPERLEVVNLPVILTETDFGRDECPKESLWAHVAEIPTLTYAGKNLSATHVAISGNIALVSYHMRGNDHRGAVEVVDLADAKKPKVTSQIIFLQADVNAIAIEEGSANGSQKVWLAMSDAKNGAVLGELSLKNKKFENNYYRNVKLAYKISGGISSSVNSIAQSNDLLYVTAGRSNGGVFTLNKSDLSLVGVKQFPNAKGVAVGTSKIACLQTSDNDANLFVENVGGHVFETNIPLSKFSHQNVEDLQGGKVSLSFSNDGNTLFLAAGATGLRAVDMSSGLEVFVSPDKMLESGNTNGVSHDDQYVYAANGADGLAIFAYDQNGLPDPSHVFVWDLNEQGASTNFVESNGDWVFVAKGEGGFKILKKPTPADVLTLCSFDNTGKPSCLQADQVVCTGIVAAMNAKLPVNGNVKIQYPQYLTTGSSEILLTEDAEISLTFLEENSNHTHAVGYYAYPADCPPSTKAELVGLVAFPNSSRQGSGGSLVSGNTIKLHNGFKANTMIGFFLVPKGWDGSKVKSGQNLLYTNKIFNSNPHKQGLIFYEDGCDAIVVAFDQESAPSANADYRDVVMKVNISSPTAVDTHDFLQF